MAAPPWLRLICSAGTWAAPPCVIETVVAWMSRAPPWLRFTFWARMSPFSSIPSGMWPLAGVSARSTGASESSSAGMFGWSSRFMGPPAYRAAPDCAACGASVTTLWSRLGRAAAQLLPTETQDHRQCLKDDAARHLARAQPAINKDDRHFDDARTGARRAERGFNLEDVAPGMEARPRQRRERRAPPRLEAAGQVVRLEAKNSAREHRAA